MMNRRDAIKNLGLSLGFVVVTPTVISLLNSCKADPVWLPEYFSQNEGYLIQSLVDIILPETDTPSASQVNVPQFIDVYTRDVMEPELQVLFKKGLVLFEKKVLETSGKDDLQRVKPEYMEPILAQVLKKTEDEERNILKAIGDYQQSIKSGNAPENLDEEFILFGFLNGLRSLSIWAYKSSEYIGEHVLAYAPIPGKQEGCVDLEAATEGKAWSL